MRLAHRHDRPALRPLAAATAAGGCTKWVVSQQGVYSPQQLPTETQTPILDTIGAPFKRQAEKANH